ncbi:hypothetical protein DVH24_026575 [Malus domestica]|uniref:RNase H type-1 domain-containing protein n=1 Tax=Malus domestica TaxID=3750 RepID=A0A498KP33_MALDO|nr:hypothetical protein DVH24_042582 [Malus domestica]RXI09558.1 hypothetical protein DVH24_026574 [Malus domestica]RXI09559.1 hypothetical protein DVH24_026575 [Malus domestica]
MAHCKCGDGGDALMVVSAIQLKVTANNGPFGHLLEDTPRILQNVGQWKTTFVRRDANRLAHRLARLGLI